MPADTDSTELDDRVVKALEYLRALIDAGKHFPSLEAQAAVRDVQRSINRMRAASQRSTWH